MPEFSPFVLTIACLLLAPAAARADPFHAQPLPLGQRALGMGGAFTAVADDPSATYYNPAGLALTGDSQLSASLTLTAFDRSRVEGGYRTSEGRSSLNHNQGTSVPVFVAALKHLGARDAQGQRRHALALSSFTVNQRRLSFDVEVLNENPTPGTLETLTIDAADRTSWHGLSYAYRVSPRLSFGLSAFLSLRRTYYLEERISALLGAVNADGSYASMGGSWTSHLVETNVKTALVRLGVLYEVNDRLRLGLMFQPPSLHLRGSARVRERRLQADVSEAAPSASVLNTSEKNLLSRSPTPWELRLGTRYAAYSWLTLAFDASLYGSSGSKADPVIAVGPRTPDPQTGAQPTVGAFVAETWYRTINGNLALGAQARLVGRYAVRAGVYTDLSSSPPVPRVSDSYQNPDVNRVGGALSLALMEDRFDVSLGVVGVIGTGTALSFNADPTGPVYERTRVTDRMFLVFLNGVRSAVNELAKRANERLQGVRERASRPE